MIHGHTLYYMYFRNIIKDVELTVESHWFGLQLESLDLLTAISQNLMRKGSGLVQLGCLPGPDQDIFRANLQS